jgi:hypothetical protein
LPANFLSLIFGSFMSIGRRTDASEIDSEVVKSEARRRKWAVECKAGRGGGVARVVAKMAAS